MKIAIIGTVYPYRGGLAAYKERLAQQLQQEGHDVTIYTFTVQYPNFLFPGKTQYSTDPAPKDLHIIRCINSTNPFNWLSVGNRIKKENYDLIIIKFWLPFMGPAFGTILRRAKSNGHTKVVAIIDNMIPHESRPGDKIFSKYFVKPVDGFVAMSQNVLEDINQFSPDKPKILSPHPLFDNFGDIFPREEALQKLKLDPADKYVLFFGLIRKYKGLDLLIEAFADPRFRNSGIKLIVAGEYYSDEEEYVNLIKEHKLEEEIIQVNKFIPNSEVADFFNASDLVVQPYKSATQSGVTQIAYHFNKPMIVTDVGGLAEMCPDGKVGFVVPTDPQAIADGMIRYFSGNFEEEMIQHIQEEKKKYSWEILTGNIFTLAADF
jgi:D-inositol-3-phosphate glycosyltransferase